MIENKDLFDSKLFVDEIKDSIKLAKSLDELDEKFKDILKTTKVVAGVDTFKNYDNLKKVELEVSKLESAVKGLAKTETIRKGLIKDSTDLTKTYNKEIKELINNNEKLLKEKAKLTKSDKEQIVSTNRINEQLKLNASRVNILSNSLQVLVSFQKSNTNEVINSIQTYREQEQQIRDVGIAIDKLDEAFIGVNKATGELGDNKGLTEVAKDAGQASGKIDDMAVELRKAENELARMNKAGFFSPNEIEIAKNNVDELAFALEQAGKAGQKSGNKIENSLEAQIKILDRLESAAKGYGQALKINAVDRVSGAISSVVGKAFDARAFTTVMDDWLLRFAGNFKTFLNGVSDFFGGTTFTITDASGKVITDEDLKADYKEIFDDIDKLEERRKKSLGLNITGNNEEEQVALFGRINTALKGIEKSKANAVLEDFLVNTEKLSEFAAKDFVNRFGFRDSRPAPGGIILPEQNTEDLFKQAEAGVKRLAKQKAGAEAKLGGVTISRITPFGEFASGGPKSTKKSAAELSILEIQFAVDGLTRVVNTSRVEFEKLVSASDDASLSIAQRIDATRDAQTKLNSLYVDENELASKRLALQQKNIQLSGETSLSGEALFQAITGKTSTGGKAVLDAELAGKLSQEQVDAFVQAFIEVDAAKLDRRGRLREVLQTRRELLSDNLELELDALLLSAATQREINEGLVSDDLVTLAKREAALVKIGKINEDSYEAQLDALIKFNNDIRKEVAEANKTTTDAEGRVFPGAELKLPSEFNSEQVDALVALSPTDVKAELDKLGLSEAIFKRILEIVEERQKATEDYNKALIDFQFEQQKVQFTKEDLIEQGEYLELLKKQNIELQALQDNFKKSKVDTVVSTPGLTPEQLKEAQDKVDKIRDKAISDSRDALEKGIKEVEDADEAFRDNQLELDIEQAEDKLALLDTLGLDTLDATRELNELLLEQQKRFLERQKELDDKAANEKQATEEALAKAKENRLKRELELATAAFAVLNALNDKVANDRLRRVDKELSDVASREQYLIGLAERGSESLTENLAFEQKKQAELEEQRERIDRIRARRALALTALETYNANLNAAKLDTNDSTPGVTALSKTALDVALLQAFVNGLPTFYDGVEDTGAGGDLDSKKGFLAVLHPHERVLTAEQNKSLAGMTNHEVVQRVKSPDRHLEAKLDELIEVTRSQEQYLGGDFQEASKTFRETVKRENTIIRKHTRTDSIF